MKKHKMDEVRKKASQLLQKAHIMITAEEKEQMEIADCGFDDIETIGLQVVVYENNDRYCAKELILLPRQICPEHRHPPIDEHNAGKQETFPFFSIRRVFICSGFSSISLMILGKQRRRQALVEMPPLSLILIIKAFPSWDRLQASIRTFSGDRLSKFETSFSYLGARAFVPFVLNPPIGRWA